MTAVANHTEDPRGWDELVENFLRPIREQVDRLARGQAPILILAERGSWPELVARRIHAKSPRSGGAFVKVGLPELTEAYVEHELFGEYAEQHLQGPNDYGGRFEQAHRGTLYLDNIGGFSPAIQAKILRQMDERRIDAAESESGPRWDVRIVAAASDDLAEKVEDGAVNANLWDALSAATVRIPPLRERRGDIVGLAQAFVTKFAKENNLPARRLSPVAVSSLLAYSWPGNADELSRIMERAVSLADGQVIGVDALPDELRARAADPDATQHDLQNTLDNLERALIEDALRAHKGNQAKAAQALGITERLMGLRVKKYGIKPRQFRSGR